MHVVCVVTSLSVGPARMGALLNILRPTNASMATCDDVYSGWALKLRRLVPTSVDTLSTATY